MSRILQLSNRYIRGRKRCKKRGCNMKLLDDIETILSTRSFTDREIVKYKVHNLSGSLKGFQELHLGNRCSDWVVIYQISGNHVKFEDTIVTMYDTGTHKDCFGAYEPDNMEIIWV